MVVLPDIAEKRIETINDESSLLCWLIEGYSLLLYLLLQGVELRGGEEFCEGDIQTVADLFYCQDLRIGAPSVENVFHR